MNDELIRDIAEKVLVEERASICKRKELISEKTQRIGPNKADVEIVNSILTILEGVNDDENKSN